MEKKTGPLTIELQSVGGPESSSRNQVTVLAPGYRCLQVEMPLPCRLPCFFFLFMPQLEHNGAFYFAVLGIEPRTAYMLGKHSIKELYT